MPDAQDTGNPVFDSLVNLLASRPTMNLPSVDTIREIHALLLELAEKEPGGLCAKTKDGFRTRVNAPPRQRGKISVQEEG